MRCLRTSLLLTAATIVAPVSAQIPVTTSPTQEAVQSPGGWIPAQNCMVEIIKEVDIAAEAQGKITELRIEEGAEVNADDVVAVIDDKLPLLNLDRAKAEEEQAILEATNEVNITDAKNNEELAKAQAEAFKALRRENATSYWEMKQKELEAKRATLRIELSEMQMKVAKAQYFVKRAETKIAEEEVNRRSIKAPFAGYIETRSAQLGQWVQPGSPIANLVQMDELKVRGNIDSLRYLGQVRKGSVAKVSITNRVNGPPVEFDGVIGYVGAKININGQFPVWVKIKNVKSNGEWLVKPGMKANILIRPEQQ